MEEVDEKEKVEKIEKFKKETPPGILKQFKNDDDIWDFIMEQESAPIRLKGVKVNASSPEEAEKITKKVIATLLEGKDISNIEGVKIDHTYMKMRHAHDELMKELYEKVGKQDD